MPLDFSEQTGQAAHNRPDTGDNPPPAQLGSFASLAVHVGVTLLGVAGLVLAISVGVGSLNEPGPGLWPLVASSLATAAGVATIVQTLLGKRVESLRGSARPALGVALTVLFVLLLSFVSVIVALLVVFVLWTRLLGGMAWRPVLCWSLLGTALLYVLFGVLLATPFPAPLTVIP
ncbi:tripartite tricarboxylate transporter TctB family protein [Saccharomonospora sp. NPDC046836]|uniref:tripartite tricarboxylate transporter TctB family protein n=1 Tax=Saccharomonospora sp. NPDC046836 TaxID=3156921 RepID=UPI0033F04367